MVVGLAGVSPPGAVTVRAAAEVSDSRRHMELLVPTIGDLMGRSGIDYPDLSAVVVGEGPGPFTGLRVGMATAAAIGQALGIPVHGVCSLDATARAARLERGIVFADARRREVYWAEYSSGRRVGSPRVTAPMDILLRAGSGTDTGDGPGARGACGPRGRPAGGEGASDDTARVCGASLVGDPQLVDRIPLDLPFREGHPTAGALVEIADLGASPAPLRPLYLRRPDAKEPAPRPRSKALPDVRG